MHICWGNYEGPHTHDIPLATVFATAMRARPSGFLFEAANPRHAHEWEDLKSAKIPDDKIMMPGCLDSTTNFVEHPAPRGAAHLQCRQYRRARAGHRRRRLRLRHLRGAAEPGRAIDRLGQARGARRRCSHREHATVAMRGGGGWLK